MQALGSWGRAKKKTQAASETTRAFLALVPLLFFSRSPSGTESLKQANGKGKFFLKNEIYNTLFSDIKVISVHKMYVIPAVKNKGNLVHLKGKNMSTYKVKE